MSDTGKVSDADLPYQSKTPGAPGAVVVAEDPAAPSKDVSSKRQSLSDLFTIVCAAFGATSGPPRDVLTCWSSSVLVSL